MIQTINNKLQKNWPLYAAIASAIMLGAAHAFETFGKMYPCALCLHQREVYWVALGTGLIGFVLRLKFKSPSLIRAVDALLGVIFLAGAVVAGFHAGVEQHWWPGLPECAASGKIDVSDDLLAALSAPAEPAGCDVIAWKFLGLSMAVWNMIISIALTFFSLSCAFKGDTGSIELE